MDANDRNAIDTLFDKLKQVEQQAPARDAEAEAHIRQKMALQPSAAYTLAQTVLIQEQAITALDQRVRSLEYELANRPASSGGFLSSLFGGGQKAPQPAPSAPWGQQSAGYGQPGYGQPGYGQPGYGQRPAGGGFLAGAAQTALGVAGGVLLGSAVASMFSDGAQAAESAVSGLGDAASGLTDSGFGVGDLGDAFPMDEEF